MRATEPSSSIDARGPDRQTDHHRNREAMRRSEPRKAGKAQDGSELLDDPSWDHHDAAAFDKAHKLLRRGPFNGHHIVDGLRRFRLRLGFRAARGFRLAPWLVRATWITGIFLAVCIACFGAVWLRLGTGPINLDIVTPWLASAIEENLGKDHTVEVGGTQIERAGRYPHRCPSA